MNIRIKQLFGSEKKNEEISISYTQLNNDINAFGTYLFSTGYKNANIAILGENSYEWIVSYFAVVNGNNVVVPIDKEATKDDVRFQLEKSDTSLLIYSNAYKDIAEFCGIKSICMNDFADIVHKGENLIEKGDKDFIETVIDKNKMCTIVFTSGTTAQPKGVMLNHKNLVADLVSSSRNLCLPGDTVIILPIHHTYGFMASVLCPMLKGYSGYINSSMKRAFDDIKYAKPKYVAVVPMIIEALYDKIWSSVKKQGKERFMKNLLRISNWLLQIGVDIRRVVFKTVLDAFGGNIEMLITGGSSIDAKYVEKFRNMGINITSGYGITECSPIVATMRNEHYEPESVGTINPDVNCRIKDGEIQVKGDIVFNGYYKDMKSTAEAFDGDWFKTGDLGRIDKDGFLYITGRKKNLIILSNGKNVSPEELENVIKDAITEVREVLVYEENNSIVAEMFCTDEVENVQAIVKSKIDVLNKNLPSYKQISIVKHRNTEFPKTSTKKIKRNYGG